MSITTLKDYKILFRALTRKYFILLLILLLFPLLFLTSCRSENIDTSDYKVENKTGYFLGTIVDIKLYAKEIDDSIFNEVFNEINALEQKLSINIETSEISQLNQAAGKNSTQLSDEAFYVLEQGAYYSKLSHGAFDVSIGPLVKLWGIGTEHAKIPTDTEILTAKNLIDYNQLTLDSNTHTAMLSQPGMIIDLGAIAKGYIADYIASSLRAKGYEHGIINLGGNVYTLGKKPTGSDWRIGIQNPFEPRGKYIGILDTSNESVVTSGIYERYFEENGVRYHHILNPKTGYPVNNNLASISIISEESIDGDGLSTTVFALGLDKGLELVNSLDNVEAIFVTKDSQIFMTKALENKFTLTNKSFKINVVEK